MADYSNTSDAEASRLQAERMQAQIRIMMPAKLLSFSPGPPQRCSVQPLIKMKVTLGKEVKYVSMPPIENVPVQLPVAQVAGLMLTLPFKPGDTGMLHIPDRGMDNFLRSGQESRPPFYGDPETSSPRSRALEDAVFYPGISPDTFEIQDYNTENIELRDKERKTRISLGPDGIEMTDGQAVISIKNGKVEVNAPDGCEATSGKAITMKAAQTCTISSTNMTLGKDSNTFSGSCTSSNGTFIDKDGVSLNGHAHTGVQTGGGTTGGPVK